MTRKLILGGFSALALGAVLAAGVVPAAAQNMQGRGPGFGPGPMAFSTLDADEDGVVTLEEFTARAADRFKALDADSDGSLTAEEMTKARGEGARRAGGERRGDRPGAGFGPGPGFGQRRGYPGCGGGRMHGPHHGAWQGGPFWGGAQAERPRGPMTEERAKAMIEMRDQNGDGLLSAEELAAGPDRSRIFDRIDADGDGSISKEEFDAARDAFRQMRGGAGQP